MAFQVEVDWCPAYELVTSLAAFASRSERRTLEIGSGWAAGVQRRLPADLLAQVRAIDRNAFAGLLPEFIRQCPGERDAGGFLDWLASLPLSDLYGRAQAAGKTAEPLRDLPNERDGAIAALRGWNEAYFQHVEPAIFAGLAAAAETARLAGTNVEADEWVESVTTGIRYQPDPVPATVVLVPQYHFRPWNIFFAFRREHFILYPAEMPAVPGQPPARLLRLTRALADESRLHILALIAGGMSAFNDVVAASGLTKSTVHHHLVALRAAGLLVVETPDPRHSTYALRREALDHLSADLHTYLAPSGSPPEIGDGA